MLLAILFAACMAPQMPEPDREPEPEPALCTEAETYVGGLVLETSEEKAEFAAGYRCVEGELLVDGDPEGCLEQLRSATELFLREPSEEISLPQFVQGSMSLYLAERLVVDAPNWTQGTILWGAVLGDLVIQAPKLQSVDQIHVGGIEDTIHASIRAPQLAQVERLSLHDVVLSMDELPALQSVSELQLTGPESSSALRLEVDMLTLGRRDENDYWPDLSLLQDKTVHQIKLDTVFVDDASSLVSVQELALLEIEGGRVNALDGRVDWVQGMTLIVDDTEMRRVKLPGLSQATIRVKGSTLYQVDLPDLVSGSLDLDGHPDLVADLPAGEHFDDLRIDGTLLSAPALREVGNLRLAGPLPPMPELMHVDELRLLDHTGADLSSIAGLTGHLDVLSVKDMPALVDLSALYDVESVGTLTIKYTAVSEAEIARLVDTIGPENIAETSFWGNAD